jgi:hypothetical protein
MSVKFEYMDCHPPLPDVVSNTVANTWYLFSKNTIVGSLTDAQLRPAGGLGLITGGPDFHLNVVGKSQVGGEPPAPPPPSPGSPPLPEADVLPPVPVVPLPPLPTELDVPVLPPVPVVLLALLAPVTGFSEPPVPSGEGWSSVVPLLQPASAASTQPRAERRRRERHGARAWEGKSR